MIKSGWRAIFALIVLALAVAPFGRATAQAPSLEYPIKATFLYRFASFVQWPASAFESAMTPIYICLLGSDPVTDALGQMTITDMVDGRPYQIRRVDRVEREVLCHILYVANPGASAAARAFEVVREAPVLTIVDSAQALRSPAIITFVVEQNRVRFDIDDAAAAERGLSISSRLLNLARMVRRRP